MSENLKSFLIFPSILVTLFVAKLLIFQSNIAESIVMLGLLALCGFVYFVENKREKPVNDEFKKAILETDKKLQEIQSFIAQNKLFGRKPNG